MTAKRRTDVLWVVELFISGKWQSTIPVDLSRSGAREEIEWRRKNGVVGRSRVVKYVRASR
jgi:hypothetical protein